jgi:hypothetical protein
MSSTSFFEERVVQVEALKPNTNNNYSEQYLTQEDGPPYFDARTGRGLNSLDDVRLPIGYIWSGNWKVSLEQPGADGEGWVVDGRIRRRWWKRRREMLTSTAPMSQKSSTIPSQGVATTTTTTTTNSINNRNSNSSFKPSNGNKTANNNNTLTPSTINDSPERLLNNATMAIQALSNTRQQLSGTSTLENATQFAEEGRGYISELKRILILIDKDPRLVAARIKLSGDVNRESEKFEQQVLTTLNRFRKQQSIFNSSLPFNNNNNNTSNSNPFAPSNESVYNSNSNNNNQYQQFQEQQYDGLKLSEVVSEIKLNEELIEQRNIGLREVNQKAATINNMMLELSDMVKQQGETVQVLVTNTAKARDDVTTGLQEVQKAETYQASGGTGGCYIS